MSRQLPARLSGKRPFLLADILKHAYSGWSLTDATRFAAGKNNKTGRYRRTKQREGDIGEEPQFIMVFLISAAV
ncbi:hypothetical protein ABUP50_000788 [Cronobacter malonaticus]|uniref:hypothetical protein n=1 Tax=Cronobacter malonaticus TaxID=413503 RepID=UPI0024AE6C59|nr:hypothetical protein [Cronobacter malonaticus]MDI6458283.1 hypothetical protein [Cronobacter malonaticus]MDT3562854.1 hypothetical protein [Cronobacter malonaticus]